MEYSGELCSSLEFYEPTDMIAGESYSTWVERWFKWILEQPKSDETHPCFCYHLKPEMQPYDKQGVWFFAGSLESLGVGPNPPNGRRETYGNKMLDHVPTDKAILMPVINAFRVEAKNNSKSVQRATELARNDINIINAGGMTVQIDDEEIPNLSKYRVESKGVFEVVLDGKNNITTLRHLFGRKIKAVAKGDGYWLFIKPNQLEPNKQHKIKTFASCSLGKVVIDISYRVRTSS